MDKQWTRMIWARCVASAVVALCVGNPLLDAAAANLAGAKPGDHMMSEHGGMDHSAHGARRHSDTASTRAYRAANASMHHDMAIIYSGDADADFVRGMIPHHQGAIDMAKVVLRYGKDPKIRKLAKGIMTAQESEIKLMRAWLAKNGR